MKILPINFFLNCGKKYFSNIPKQNTAFLQKAENLLRIDTLTTDMYYKTISNINFGHRLSDEESKKLDEKIRNSYKSAGNISKFCRNNHISIYTYHYRLNHFDDKQKLVEERQKAIEKKNKQIRDKVIENYESYGNVKTFCQENHISQNIYYSVLKELGIHKNSDANKNKELNMEIRKNHETGGNIEKFCKEHNISSALYFNRLRYNGEDAIQKRRKLRIEKQKKLNEAILENYKNDEDIKEFCKKQHINDCTYYRRLKQLGINLKEKNKIKALQQNIENYKLLDEEIKKNYETGGQILPFCKEKRISTATYYKRLKILGLI